MTSPSFENEPCPGCGDGDSVPATGYFICQVCDAEWNGEDLGVPPPVPTEEGPKPVVMSLNESERHELECLRARVQQIAYPCSPHCDGYLRELALRNAAQSLKETSQ